MLHSIFRLCLVSILLSLGNPSFAKNQDVEWSCSSSEKINRRSDNDRAFVPSIPMILPQGAESNSYRLKDFKLGDELHVEKAVEGVSIDQAEGVLIIQPSESSLSAMFRFKQVRRKWDFVRVNKTVIKKNSKGSCVRYLNVYVSFDQKHAVSSFQHSVSWAFGGVSDGVGQLALPYGSDFIIQGRKEELLLSDCTASYLYRLGKDGRFIDEVGGGLRGNKTGIFNTPADVQVSPLTQNVYVVEERNHRIQVFDKKLRYLDVFGAFGRAGGDAHVDEGYFNNPLSVTFLSSGNFFVSDYGNHRIQKFDKDANFLSKFGRGEGSGRNGTGAGEFTGPYYMEVSSRDELYVVDRGNHRVQQFDSNGRFIRMFGGGVTGKSSNMQHLLNFPHELAIDHSDLIYVTDTNNDRIQVYYSNGKYMNSIQVPGTRQPKTIAVDSDGDLYVGFVDADRFLLKISLDSSFFRDESTLGSIGVIEADEIVRSPQKESSEQAASGQALFARHCASCHQSENKVFPQVDKKSDWVEPLKKSDTELYLSARDGKGLMPPMAGCDGCSRMDIKKAVDYLIDELRLRHKGTVILTKIDDLVVDQKYANAQGFKPIPADNYIESDGFIIAGGYSFSGALVNNSFEEIVDFPLPGPKDEVPLMADVAYLGKNLFVFTSYRHGNIFVVDREGRVSSRIFVAGAEPDGSTNLVGVEKYGKEDFIVADYLGHNLKIFDRYGNIKQTLLSKGSGPGETLNPYAIKIRGDLIYLSSKTNNRIQVVDHDGKFVAELKSFDTSRDESISGTFSDPQGFDFDEHGNLFVVDSGNKRIVVFDPNLKFKVQLVHPELYHTRFLMFDGNGDIVVTGYQEDYTLPAAKSGLTRFINPFK